MILSFLRIASQYCHQWLLVLTGILSGIYLLAWCHIFAANFGITLTATTALGLTLALAITWGSRCSRPAARSEIKRTSPAATARNALALIGPFGLAHFGLAVWTFIFPSLVEAAWVIAAQVPSEVMAWPAVQFAFLFLTGLVGLAIPVIWLVRFPGYWLDAGIERSDVESTNSRRSSNYDGSRRRHTTETYLMALSFGILLNAVCLAPLFGIQSAAFLAALVSCLLFLTNTIGRFRSALTTPKDTSPAVAPHKWPQILRRELPRVIAAGCVGLLLAGQFRIIHQLMLVSSWLIATQWSLIILGVALGRLWFRRRGFLNSEQSRSLPVWPVTYVAVGLWSIGLLAAFGLLVNLCLTLNSHVQQVWILLVARSLLMAVALIPIGFGWGVMSISEESSSFGHGPRTEFAQLHPLAVAAGYFLCQCFVLPVVGVANSMVVASWLLVGIALWTEIQSRGQRSRRLFRIVAVVAMLFLVAVPFWHHIYDPAHSAKLLFDTNVFIANRLGHNREFLPFLNEGRLVNIVEGECGTYTVWKSRGSQLQIRECGVPKAMVSTDPNICPHYSPEVLVTAIPLVLHERPHRVLLLGLSGGIPLTTCLSFPVQVITCVEPDTALIRVVSDVIAAETGTNPLADDLVRLCHSGPELAVACHKAPYDVIVSCLDQPALMRSMSSSTVEFYRRVSRRLSRAGIFCQRIQHVDVGAESIQRLFKTMIAAFRDTAAIEVAPGEMLLLGTNAPEGLRREKLIERIQAPQVKSVLSQLGWDWSVPLNLPTYDHEALVAVSSKHSCAVHSSLNGFSAFRMPLDVVRWSSKIQEFRTLLARHAGRLLMWLGESGDDSEVLRRLAEVNSQQRLMSDHPDEYWMYRKAVKEQVTQRPRSLIQQVSHRQPKRRIHPEDRRRMRYFQALADAAKQPTLQNINQVASFHSPYDPLISYFVHQEVAELYSRCGQRDVEREFSHRLYAIYFASSSDRSVRNVADALKLLAAHPQAVSDPFFRWDHFSGLLQMLKSRWYVRSSIKPSSSPIVLNDIEQSISAIETTFQVMGELSEQIGLPAKDWDARRKVVEQSLVRPLRAYRSKVLSQHYRSGPQNNSRK